MQADELDRLVAGAKLKSQIVWTGS